MRSSIEASDVDQHLEGFPCSRATASDVYQQLLEGPVRSVYEASDVDQHLDGSVHILVKASHVYEHFEELCAAPSRLPMCTSSPRALYAATRPPMWTSTSTALCTSW